MTDANELRGALAQFTGTETWYRHPLARRFVYTDGVKFFAENAGGGAYWLLDILGTQPEIATGVTDNTFAVVVLTVADGEGALTVSQDMDGSAPEGLVYQRGLDFTDCPEGVWKFYMVFDGEHIVCLLPSEY